MKLVCAILVIFLVECVMSQYVSVGCCPEVQPKSEFKIKPFMGQWFGLKKFPWQPTEDLTCNSAIYTQTSENTITVANSGVNKTTNEPSAISTLKGTMLCPGVFRIVGEDADSEDFDWTIMATDYRQYAATYACKQLTPKIRKEWYFMLGRERQIDAKYIKKALVAYRKNGVDSSEAVDNDQSNCPVNC